ncbi:MAG: tRNA pseudouridine(38-40) synthase TruA [Planctomycetes bacterium]|nr:tRNA pseudouridine(38-40) synthase TruA [Planctomycetota bacterium]
MPNIRLTLAYDGTNYVGWQVQPNGLSVQEVVTRAIGKVVGEEVNLLSAGRTDSGVHALGQVASFHTTSSIPPQGLQAAIQNHLPDDIVIRYADEVAEDFHATYSARWKRYRYIILNRRLRDPFVRNYAWRFPGRLDAARMHEAARVLVGTHDFRSFESQFPNRATSVRTVLETRVDRAESWPLWQSSPRASASAQPLPPRTKGGQGGVAGDFVWFDIVANGFLYNMVRAIAGTLVRVGRGAWSADDVRRILEAGDRTFAGDTAPACGLYLVEVGYEEFSAADEVRHPTR